jgi:uncharacterized protein (TIGR03546 family)
MFGLEILVKIFKILRSDASPKQISAGVIIGMIIGLTPFWTLHNLILIVLVIILSVNIGSVLFSFIIFSAIGYLLDPLFHHLGYFLLVDIEALKGLWTTLYNLPVIALSRYNNTVVMGSLLVAIILTIPLFFLVKKGVIYYRENIDSKMQKWKIIRVIKGSKIYNLYEKFRNLGD